MINDCFGELLSHVDSFPRWRTRLADIPPVLTKEGRFAFQRVKSIIASNLLQLYISINFYLLFSGYLSKCALHIIFILQCSQKRFYSFYSFLS